MKARYPLAAPGPTVPSEQPRIDWTRLARKLQDLHRDHPGGWLIVDRCVPSRVPFEAYRIESKLGWTGFRFDRFARKTLPRKSESAEKLGWEIWMRVSPEQEENA